MSAIAGEVRTIASALLPAERTIQPPSIIDVELAIRRLRALTPRDAYDEAAVHEAGVLLLMLRDAAERRETR